MKNTQDKLSAQAFVSAAYIKEIGRGKEGARDLSRDDAYQLYAAMLDQRVSDLEMGGILLAMRIKGESIEEIAGFLSAAEDRLEKLSAPSGSKFAPVVIPSYNGARKRPNLTPLLAMLLAREGVPVVVHGLMQDAGRVCTAEIFESLDVHPARSMEQAQQQLAEHNLAFVPISVLSPSMYRLLMMRKVLGLRNSTHTLVKLLQPLNMPALRLTSYTHPEYQLMLDRYFRELAPHDQGAVLLMRGTEGETVASTGRAQQIDSYLCGVSEVVQQSSSQLVAEPESLPSDISAQSTAAWINEVVNGRIPIPSNIAQQVQHCLQLAKKLKSGVAL